MFVDFFKDICDRAKVQGKDSQEPPRPYQRRFRTVVDKMGMGDHIEGYNEQLEQVTAGIYNNFGMSNMLKLKM